MRTTSNFEKAFPKKRDVIEIYTLPIHVPMYYNIKILDLINEELQMKKSQMQQGFAGKVHYFGFLTFDFLISSFIASFCTFCFSPHRHCAQINSTFFREQTEAGHEQFCDLPFAA